MLGDTNESDLTPKETAVLQLALNMHTFLYMLAALTGDATVRARLRGLAGAEYFQSVLGPPPPIPLQLY